MTVLKSGPWLWLLAAVVLLFAALVLLEGTAATIALAAGFVALFGGGVRAISRNDPTPAEERRVPAGHSGI